MGPLLAFSYVFLFFVLCEGAIYQSIEDLPSRTFDFVVIGGGTAGCVMGNRLSENPEFSVLVVEAGVSNEGVLSSEVPGLGLMKLGGFPWDWNYTTTPQAGFNGRAIDYPRGHILGGSSSVNAMVYSRGSSEDYDRWAAVTGDPGWSWDRIQQYLRKNEKWTPPADNHNTTGQFNPKVHSFTGINSVSLEGFQLFDPTRVFQTTTDLPDEFPFNLDYNSGRPLGVGYIQSTVGNGTRSSSAVSYLGPKFIDRLNLHVVLNTRGIRVLPIRKDKTPDFRVVEFSTSAGGPNTRVTAEKEVILSSGAIGTPHLLLHSGIGDEIELKGKGIMPVLNLPSVGKNLTDHPVAYLAWATTANNTQNTSNNATLLAEALDQWEKTRTGPLTIFAGGQLGWVRAHNNSIFKTVKDPAAGPTTPHIEFEFAQMDGPTIGPGSVLLTPTSRGSVTLQSNNPSDPPLIDPAFLQTDIDMFLMREGIKSAQRFISGPAWQGFVTTPIAPPENATTDALLDEYLRANTQTNYHPTSTAMMSRRGASYGVVDPDLRLKGAKGLRVVDASIMPFLTAGHTQVPVYIIAERASDLIKEAWPRT